MIEWEKMTKNKKRRRTTHMRVYQDTLEEVRQRFGNVRTADFFDISIKSNPLLQTEGMLRKILGDEKKKKNRKEG